MLTCYDCQNGRNICPASGKCRECCGDENLLHIMAGKMPPRRCKCR